MDYKITMTLDKRRQLKNGQYPIKIRVWSGLIKKAFRISTKITAHDDEFTKCWNLTPKQAQSLNGKLREKHLVIDVIYNKALEAAKGMDFFDIEVFERKLFRRATDKFSIPYHFNTVIEELTKKGRIGAASSYRCTKVSLMKFESQRTRRHKDALSFYEITPKWLYEYESYMIDDNGKSTTTVGIYARTLKAIFNRAIESKDLERKYYPFGKGRYEIPEKNKVKKTLKREQVALMHSAILPPLQEKARDFWFFSYSCNGMNFRDMAMLRFENIKDGKITYYREKTKLKKRVNIKEISFKLNSLSSLILDKYKTEYRGEKSYVFPILDDSDNPLEIHRKVANWIRSTNQQLKHIAVELNFPNEFSTYWARHSYSTNMLNMGASIEFVSEALNHSDISTTQHYFDGFEDETKNELMEKLIDF